jgi:hypothetical protein
LRRAEAQLQLSTVLAEHSHATTPPLAAQLAAAQERFYHYCRYAERELMQQGRRPDFESGPHGQGLTDWLHELKEQNRRLAQRHAFLEKPRAQAERHVASGALAGRSALAGPEADNAASDTRAAPALAEGASSLLPERGTPTYWMSNGASPPHVQLTPVKERQNWLALFGSAVLLVLALGVWFLSYLPRVAGWVRALWPEQVALIGYLFLRAWPALDPNWVAAFLILLGVCGRLFWLGRHVLARLHRPAQAPASAAGGSAPSSL